MSSSKIPSEGNVNSLSQAAVQDLLIAAEDVIMWQEDGENYYGDKYQQLCIAIRQLKCAAEKIRQLRRTK